MPISLTYSSESKNNLQQKIEDTFNLKLTFIANKHTINNLVKNQIDFFITDKSLDISDEIDYFYFKKFIFYFKRNHLILNFHKQLIIPPVAFVSAGPGKRQWLTLEAYNLLQLGDICFYDALVSQEILDMIAPKTELYYVGKRGDSLSFNQQKINSLLSHYARMNKKVIRLKGGDCGILGRITEEIKELNTYAIPYTITPGITAMQGLPSEYGIFATQRQVSDGFVVTTARQAGGEPTQVSERIKSTLIIYMGILKIKALVNQLLNEGYPISLPIAIAINLSRPNKQFIFGTLENIVSKTEKAKVRPPGLIICGEICKEKYIIPPPSFIFLAKKILVYSNTIDMKLQNELLFWGAYDIKFADNLDNLDYYNAVIALKELTEKEKGIIKSQKILYSLSNQLSYIKKDFFIQSIS